MQEPPVDEQSPIRLRNRLLCLNNFQHLKNTTSGFFEIFTREPEGTIPSRQEITVTEAISGASVPGSVVRLSVKLDYKALLTN